MPSFSTPARRILTSPITKPRKKRLCLVRNLVDNCTKNRLKDAVNTLPILYHKGIRLDTKTLAFLLQNCANSKSLQLGKWVHLHLKLIGLKHPNAFLANHLINMYGKCGDHVAARKVFDRMAIKNLYSWNNMLSGYAKLGMVRPAKRLFDQMPEKDVVSWNTMIIAYAQHGYYDKAVRFYKELRRSDNGIQFNEYSFAGILTVCVKLKEMSLCKQVHCQVAVTGLLLNVVLSSSIVDAYAKCGELGCARRLFDEMGREKDVLAWTTLVSGYAKWGDMTSAREIFNLMPQKNPVSWTTLISGYVQNGMGDEGLHLFAKMMRLHVKPDQFTFSSCLRACASIPSLKLGKAIHGRLILDGFKLNVVVSSSLIDMYSKCGCLEVANRVFDFTGDKKDIVLWNTVLSALAHHGSGQEAVKKFGQMLKLGVRPDRVTLLVLLNACSHSGLVQEGLRLFKSMSQDHIIVPDQEHYACLIDLLGRAGQFDEVMNLLKEMPCEPNDHIWNSLMGVCRIHGNVELGRTASRHLIKLDPKSPAAHLLLTSIYAALGKWESVEKVRHLMNERQVRKEQALSWLDIDDELHSLIQSNKSLHSSETETNSIEGLSADPVEI